VVSQVLFSYWVHKALCKSSQIWSLHVDQMALLVSHLNGETFFLGSGLVVGQIELNGISIEFIFHNQPIIRYNTDCCSTMLQAGRSQVRFRMRLFDFLK
jgi:hypothetical protein